jgi:Zn-dependent peptidase ImmA (M78 family)/DNA-binding XRE family transcriptional regulator
MSARLFQPPRLRLARKLRGITQKELAQRLEVTPAAISQYESGTYPPTTEMVERLALALKCLPEFFFRPLLADDVPAFFRSLRAAPKAEQERARSYAVVLGEVADVLDVDVELPAVDVPELRIPADAPEDDVEAAAAELRRAWGVEAGPVAHVVRLLEAHGVVVVAVHDFDARLDAFSLWHGHRPVVVLCSEKGVPKRRRFDAAHELGHLVLHDRGRTGDPVLERQAHRFASALLMPAGEIEEWLPRRPNQIEVLRRASEVWGVSMQALLYRARTLGVMSEAGFTRAMRRMSALGWRTNEPVLAGPEERPSLLGSAVDALRASGGSMQRLASSVGLPEGRLCRMVAVPEERALEASGLVLDFRQDQA